MNVRSTPARYLKCHSQRELAKPDNWIELTEEDISALTCRDVRRAKHLIGVSMPAPDSIEHYGSGITFDSSSGGLVTGFSSCGSTPDSGVEELKSLLREAREEGHDRAILYTRWSVPVRGEHRVVPAKSDSPVTGTRMQTLHPGANL